jgi:heme A synthase
MSAKRFPLFAWGVLGYSLVVIAWGYFLRISESGAGCGRDWPLCEGSIVPRSAEFPTWVELIHRMSSGLVLVLVLGMAFWALRAFPKGHAVRRAAIASLVLTITESLFGALLVVFGWVAGDISTARILIRPLQVVNNFSLMAALGLTAWWALRGVKVVPSLGSLRNAGILPPAAAVLVLASTGSWTGLADTAFPVDRLGEGLAQYVHPEHVLIYLRTVHPFVALVSVAIVARFATRAWKRSGGPFARRLVLAVALLVGAQLLLGPLTILLLHPPGLRLFHLAVADLLWLSLVFLSSTIVEARASFPTPERSYSSPRDSAQSLPGSERS